LNQLEVSVEAQRANCLLTAGGFRGMNNLLRCIVAAAALASASCSDSHNLKPVSGTVTYKGKPAAGAAVFFQHQGGDPMSEHLIMGIVQDDGSFTLVCGPHGAGAPPGEYDVFVDWKQDRGQPKGLAVKTPDRLKGRYADRKHARLHAVVKAEINQLPPFELTD
jgi:hypothetical protein